LDIDGFYDIFFGKAIVKLLPTSAGLFTTIFLLLKPDESGLGKKDFRFNPVYYLSEVMLFDVANFRT